MHTLYISQWNSYTPSDREDRNCVYALRDNMCSTAINHCMRKLIQWDKQLRPKITPFFIKRNNELHQEPATFCVLGRHSTNWHYTHAACIHYEYHDEICTPPVIEKTGTVCMHWGIICALQPSITLYTCMYMYMYLTDANMHACMHVGIGIGRCVHVHGWWELVHHQWSLTPTPSSQGWACGLSLDWYYFYVLYLRIYIFLSCRIIFLSRWGWGRWCTIKCMINTFIKVQLVV